MGALPWDNFLLGIFACPDGLRGLGVHDLPGLTVCMELRTTRVGHPCIVTWTLLCRHTLPVAVLIEPLRTHTARFTLGGYLVGRQGK